MFLMMEDPHWCVQNFFLQYSLPRFAVGFLLEAQVPSRLRIISRSADTPSQNLYQTDTDICFEIHIKPIIGLTLVVALLWVT